MKLLEIYLDPINEQRFKAIATQSPAGDGGAESSLPFWDGETDWRTTLIKILEGAGVFYSEHFLRPGEQDWMVSAGLLQSDRTSFAPSYLESIGAALYESLFPPASSLRTVLQAAQRLAEQDNTALHLRLKFAADSTKRSRLADYPWELLCNERGFLQHRDVLISRYIAYESLPPNAEPQAQIRVLLLSSHPHDPAGKLAALSDAEQQAIRVGLGKAESEGVILLEQLPHSTFDALTIDLTQRSPAEMPQVLHFDGHGLFGKRCANPACKHIHAGTKVEHCQRCRQSLPAEPTGFLVFEDKNGQPDYVSAPELAAALPKGIALVVLSACQSGMAVAGESVFNGTAQQLIDRRIPAVVAMQYAVRVDAASRFAEQFYRVLGQRKPLTVAVNEGQKWMGVDENQWYRPVLYLRWLDNQGGQLFSALSAQAQPTASPVKVEDRLPEPLIETEKSLSPAQKLKLQYLQTKRANLEQQLGVVQSELEAVVDVMIKGQYENRLNLLFKQIEQVDQEIQKIEGRNDE